MPPDANLPSRQGSVTVTAEDVRRWAVESALSDIVGDALKRHENPTADELALEVGYLVLGRVGRPEIAG